MVVGSGQDVQTDGFHRSLCLPWEMGHPVVVREAVARMVSGIRKLRNEDVWQAVGREQRSSIPAG
jgi:hypothetical protein